MRWFTGILASLAMSCTPIGHEGPEGPWPYLPVKMRIHPVSHVTAEGKSQQLALHIEFLDKDGCPTRSTGVLIVACWEPGQAHIERTIELGDQETNNHVFNRATRTYEVIMDLPPEPRASSIRVDLTLHDGTISLSATGVVTAAQPVPVPSP